MPELNTYLEDVSFDFEESEDSLGAHIALTFDFQGGAASGYNKPLLFKADNTEINKDLIIKLKELGEDTTDLEKAMYANDLRNMLNQKIREKEFVDKYDSVWVSDWNDSVAIFTTDSGTYSVDYTSDGTNVEVGDVANPVVPIQDYVVIGNDILVSEDLMDSMEQDVYDMLAKSLSQPATVEVIKAATKKVGSSTLTASDYAYTPDKEKPSTWKLRIDDARHTSAAVAALGKGFRGNKVEIPEEDLASVKAKVRKAYKKFFPDNDVPDIIKSLENKNSVIESEDKDKSEGNSSGKITKKQGANIVDLNELLKSAEAQEMLKSLIADATKEKDAEKEELAKSLKQANERLEAVEKAEQKRIKTAYEDVVKGFGFVEEDKVEEVVKALMADTENSVIFIEMLNKAHEEIEKVKAEFASEKGSDRKAEAPKDGVEKVKAIAAVLKAKQSK